MECCPKNSEQVKEKTAVRGNNQFAYSDYWENNSYEFWRQWREDVWPFWIPSTLVMLHWLNCKFFMLLFQFARSNTCKKNLELLITGR